MQEEKQSGLLSVIVALSVIIGALASAVAILYYFREKIGLERLVEKYRSDGTPWDNCCCISDDCDEAYSEDSVATEA